MNKKVLIIGLDCAPPKLIFERWREELPNLNSLINNSVYGELKSITPPITVPAWMGMMTGQDPGALGTYGFRNRINYKYDGLKVINSKYIKEKAIWDYLTDAGKKSYTIGIPPTYPPSKLNGGMVSGFLTPSNETQFTYPASLKDEIQDKFGEYIFDVSEFRTDQKDELLDALYKMTDQRFQVADYLMRNKDWDFFAFVEMGLDRFNHAFWKFFDETHYKYEPGNQYEDEGLKYYKYIDSKVGDVLNNVDDDTIVVVASDHGAKKMEGAICINEWLIDQGYLHLKEDYPQKQSKVTREMIDWDKTKIWAFGGYYSRLFFNVKGREPNGVIPQNEYESFRDKIIRELESLGDENGNPIGTKVYRPEDLYDHINRIPPDLVCLFGDLDWRAAGTIGNNTYWLHENDTGPDDANHAQNGVFIMAHDQFPSNKKLSNLDIVDVAPTVLELLNHKIPEGIVGESILKKL